VLDVNQNMHSSVEFAELLIRALQLSHDVSIAAVWPTLLRWWHWFTWTRSISSAVQLTHHLLAICLILWASSGQVMEGSYAGETVTVDDVVLFLDAPLGMQKISVLDWVRIKEPERL
jgi:hypothetical protein